MNIEQRFERGLITPLTAASFSPQGRMPVRTARAIGQSPWSIGCETIDRAYVDFDHTGAHLSDLGATKARVQAGWARCEPHGDGVYDWAWLDAIVDGCLAQGVRPWLECSYGNPRYVGGGGIGLGEGIPKSAEGLAGWDRWVAALVRRYNGRVTEWEVWNEPDHTHGPTPDEYVDFFCRTASVIRSAQPGAVILGLALAGRTDYAVRFLQRLHEVRQTHLLNHLTYHYYPHNPDAAFDNVDRIAAAVHEYAPHVKLRQGETGAPSEIIRFMAMGEHEWSERKQAAWDARRLLAHHARGIEMSLFQLADMFYEKKQGALHEGRNPKGLLCIRPDKSVAYRKPAYAMAQHVFSLFDSRFSLLPARSIAPDETTAAFVWSIDGKPAVVGWWRCDAPPELTTPPLRSIALPRQPLYEPLLLELLSGELFEPTGLDWSRLPLADVPLLFVDRKLVAR